MCGISSRINEHDKVIDLDVGLGEFNMLATVLTFGIADPREECVIRHDASLKKRVKTLDTMPTQGSRRLCIIYEQSKKYKSLHLGDPSCVPHACPVSSYQNVPASHAEKVDPTACIIV